MIELYISFEFELKQTLHVVENGERSHIKDYSQGNERKSRVTRISHYEIQLNIRLWIRVIKAERT